jgi:hypothetical protein
MKPWFAVPLDNRVALDIGLLSFLKTDFFKLRGHSVFILISRI